MTTVDVYGLLRSVQWPVLYPSTFKRVLHDVPLVPQTSNWDCGLACVLMALRQSGDAEASLNTLSAKCPTDRYTPDLLNPTLGLGFSIWTIDLAYLMHQLGMRFVFLTRNLGADPDYAALPYYSEQMLQDQLRVNDLFARSAAENIPILQQSLHLQYLRRLCLSECCLIILLVDHRKLRALREDELYCWFWLGINMDLGYEGHYVLVSGYDERARKFHLHDPAGHCYWVGESVLDAARLSYGTDEDMIIVYMT